MSINLLEKVQENLHYPPLQKIDPNTQEFKGADKKTGLDEEFSQAAIPAVLTGLIKYSSSDIGAETILRGNYSSNWVAKIFGGSEPEVIENIALYTGASKDVSLQQMNQIADEAIKIANETVAPTATINDIKTFFSGQLNHVLPYLPAALHIGDLLEDTALDDNTNKMEGPISGLMHQLGNLFSSPETENKQ